MTSQSGGSLPGGSAGGVLGGSYPNPVFATNGTTPILGTVSSQLGANVTMTSANQYYDGPSVSLTAGTWLILASATIVAGAGVADITGKLWDGATVLNSDEWLFTSTSVRGSIVLFGVLVVAATATAKLSIASSSTGYAILAAADVNGAGNNASTITAIRIA